MGEIARPLRQIETEIAFFQGQIVMNAVEIGKRLAEAKQQVKHGEWELWVRNNKFSPETARRYMQIAEEFKDAKTLPAVGFRKLYLLSEMPKDQRREFIQSNPVNEMSTRELQTAIKAKKEAERLAKEAEAKAQKANEQVDDLLAEVKRLNKEMTKTPEPQIIEKEVIPESIKTETERLIREKDRLQSENKTLKLDLEIAKEKTDSTKGHLSLEAKVSHFTGQIRIFLNNMAPLGYMGKDALRTSSRAQQEYDNALSSLEKWCRDMRENMNRPDNVGNIIDAEVIE